MLCYMAFGVNLLINHIYIYIYIYILHTKIKLYINNQYILLIN